jgi:AcrR family transcriptional regulator
MPLVARQGLAGVSLEDLATRAGVTRNLLYHYFPRGRADVVLAVVEVAEHQLGSAFGPEAGQLTALLDHARAPTHAWRIHCQAAAAGEPELRTAVARVAEDRVRALSLAHLGTDVPRPIADAALSGYLGFAEAALERGRTMGLTRGELAALLDRTLRAALDAATR